MRTETSYMKEKICGYEFDIRNLEEKLQQTRDELQRNTAAQVQSQNLEYNHLQAQLDQERNDFVSLNNRLHATEKHLEIKSDQFIKLQTEFNDVCRAKQDLEARVEELKLLIRGEKASEHQVTTLENRLR
jgi:chromosome segregation ATPase